MNLHDVGPHEPPVIEFLRARFMIPLYTWVGLEMHDNQLAVKYYTHGNTDNTYYEPVKNWEVQARAWDLAGRPKNTEKF